MDNTITAAPKTINWQKRKQLVSWSGYAAIGLGTLCGVTGIVKVPQKRNIHKISAYLTGITAFIHLGFAKGWDKIFSKNK